MSEDANPKDLLLTRALYLAGQLDTTGATVDEILAKPLVGQAPTNIDERARLAIGRVGELVGERNGNVVAVKPGPVTVTVSKIP